MPEWSCWSPHAHHCCNQLRSVPFLPKTGFDQHNEIFFRGKVENLLDSLLNQENYDSRIRPNYEGRLVCVVLTNVFFLMTAKVNFMERRSTI